MAFELENTVASTGPSSVSTVTKAPPCCSLPPVSLACVGDVYEPNSCGKSGGFCQELPERMPLPGMRAQ